MRVSHYNQFRVLTAVASEFELLVANGVVVDISASVSRTFHGASMGIEADTYERFIEWNSSSMRVHGIHLEQCHRLMAMIDAAASLGVAAQASDFVCRAVDTRGRDSQARRAIFTLRQVKHNARQAWVIEAIKR